MKKYMAEIKEVGNPSVLTPSLTISLSYYEMSRDELVKFWGLNEPDVEWFRVYKIVDGQKVEMKS